MAAKKNSKSNLLKKIIKWMIVIAILYVLTSATVKSGIVEETKPVQQQYVEKVPFITEKTVQVTKYKEEKTPYGTPRCEQFPYNYTKVYTYSEHAENGSRVGVCTFDVTNQEDLAGDFDFYPNLLKSGKISDGANIIKTIPPLGTVRFEWNTTLELSETLSCMLQPGKLPVRMRCFYLEPTIYQIKQVPYTVEEKKNITDFKDEIKTRTVSAKENVTKNIYTNRFFGYNQFFYFGY